MTFMDPESARTLNLVLDDRRGAVMGLRVVSTGVEHRLDPAGRRWVLGKASDCDVVLADRCVSGLHCILERTASGSLMTRDQRSRNGTRIDGIPIEAAELRLGSQLTVGKTTLVAIGAPGFPQVSARVALRGRDPGLLSTIELATRAAQTECSVLIVGETGTGKELIARVIHEASRRTTGPLVSVNCGGIPHDLIGSELFGHERGAFTGAHADREGYFAEAHGGTLFLDEIGELPLELQPHLLRALETKRVRRVGGSSERAVDVRVVAATNRLDGLGTDTSRLRLDLFHRVATVVIALPPLRERMGDLVELVESAMAELAPEQGIRTLSDAAWNALGNYAWPGNVRELRHAVARAVALGGPVLEPRDFFSDYGGPRTIPLRTDDDALAPYQSMLRQAMEQALARHGTIRAAATHLGMAKSTFADRARQWGLVARERPHALLKKTGG